MNFDFGKKEKLLLFGLVTDRDRLQCERSDRVL